jgi:hypothetical protein
MPVKTRDNLGGSCGEGSLADPHSGGWVFLSEDIQKFLFPDSLEVLAT